MNTATLIEMLKYKRPSFSTTEKEFIEKYIMVAHPSATMDGYGNVIINTCDNPNTIFSCHTDTVDTDEGFRDIFYDEIFNLVYSIDDILGADDCAGVYIMLDMISHNIPGRYIFHREEEQYCGGSTYIKNVTPHILHGIDKAIAFDRMGDSDVIDKMILGECVEPNFAEKLCVTLSDSEYQFHTATGIYTDTMMYRDIIKNCTNVSVGYHNQHSNDEFLDLEFFNWLVEKVKTIDWQSL